MKKYNTGATILVTQKSMNKIIHLIENPPEPSEALKKLFKKGDNMKKIGKFNIMEDNKCTLPCKCGWNLWIGGKEPKDYKWLKKILLERGEEKDDREVTGKIVKWLYVNDGVFDTREEWRQALVDYLEEVL